MLAASGNTPNSRSKAPPKPENWRGVPAYLQEARQAFEQKEYARAETLLLELLEFAPAEVRAWELLAHAQKALGKIQSAIQSAERALALKRSAAKKPQLPVSLTLARLLWEQNDRESARAMLAILLMRHPDNPELLKTAQEWGLEIAE